MRLIDADEFERRCMFSREVHEEVDEDGEIMDEIIYGRYIKGKDIKEMEGQQYITVMNATEIIDKVANDVREIVEREYDFIADDFRTVLDLLTAWAPIVERDGFNFIIREQLVDLLKTLGDKYEID